MTLIMLGGGGGLGGGVVPHISRINVWFNSTCRPILAKTYKSDMLYF